MYIYVHINMCKPPSAATPGAGKARLARAPGCGGREEGQPSPDSSGVAVGEFTVNNNQKDTQLFDICTYLNRKTEKDRILITTIMITKIVVVTAVYTCMYIPAMIT